MAKIVEVSGKRPKLPAQSLAAWRAMPEQKMNWLVEDLLPADGLSLLTADPKAGKSTLARCLSTCVATGQPWLGIQTRQGEVLHLALEERGHTVLTHFDALKAPDHCIDVQIGQAPEVGQQVRMLYDYIEERCPTLVVVDTLCKLRPISNLKDYAECSAAMAPLIEMSRRFECHIMLLHHSRKSGGEYGSDASGSAAIAGAVDVHLTLSRHGERGRILSGHGRDDVFLEKTNLTVEGPWLTLAESQAQKRKAEIDRLVLDYLSTVGESSQRTICENLRGRRADVILSIKRLALSREIYQSGSGGKGDPFRYSIDCGS